MLKKDTKKKEERERFPLQTHSWTKNIKKITHARGTFIRIICVRGNEILD